MATISELLRDATVAALADLGVSVPPEQVEVTPAQRREHGDYQTNAALRLARTVACPPRDLAERLAARLPEHTAGICARVEVAGPGFVNCFLAPAWLHGVLREVVAAGPDYGHGTAEAGRRINLEFVSANPTGPLHAGGGRWVAVGDAVANLLAAQGAQVHREYYLNDAGTQLDTFVASLRARLRGEEPPPDGYHGRYLVEMAEELRAEHGDDPDPEVVRAWGLARVVAMLEADLARIGVHFDTWFSEQSLHDRGEVAEVLAALAQAGVTYERDGAVWLHSRDLGDTRDRVLVRSDGTTTYLANDIAYHRNKVRRGFDHLIDIWGADHHGQVASLQAGLRALGIGTAESPEPEVILGQLVRLERGGELVRISKRAGDVITLADILDEVDPDAARLTFLLQSIDTPQTFDVEVVTSASLENPVYYVQYAHARISSIGRVAAARGVVRPPLEDTDLGVLTDERELDLLRSLAAYPEVLATAAALRAPHRVTTWVRELAARVHRFYRDCRVLTDDPARTAARLWLAEAARVGLAGALRILGVSAPERMERLDDGDDDAAGAPDAPAAPAAGASGSRP